MATITPRPQGGSEHTHPDTEHKGDPSRHADLWQRHDGAWTARCGLHTCTGSKEACVEWLGQHGHQPPEPWSTKRS